jgi:hypothetical protein
VLRVPAEAQALFLLQKSRLDPVPMQASYHASGVLPLGIKQQLCEEYYSHPSSAKVKNERSFEFVACTGTTFPFTCLLIAHLLRLMNTLYLGVFLIYQKYINRYGKI